MKVPQPSSRGFTIYSKSICPACVEAKKVLELDDYDYKLIMCDEFLETDYKEFGEIMRLRLNVNKFSFPIIFYNGKYIGGYRELCVLLSELSS